jgi:type IV pilus assembly protein PilN
MIRINLLPVRAAKKKESLRFQLTLAGLAIFFILSLSIAYTLKLGSDIAVIEEDVASAEAEQLAISKKIGELSEIKKQKSIVQSKLDVVANLEKGRSGPVEMFLMIEAAIPERAWLKSMVDSGRKITLVGTALSEDIVADMMRRLKSQSKVKNVQLIETRAADDDLGLVSFNIILIKG